jgi:hypothetical protein
VSTYRTVCTIPIEIEILNYESGYPAKVSGPPENCYPCERPVVEYEGCLIIGKHRIHAPACVLDDLADEVMEFCKKVEER